MTLTHPLKPAGGRAFGWRWLGLALVLAGAHAAEPEIEFSGVVGGGRELRLILTAKTTGSSRWVEVGQVFAGYTVTAYEAKEDIVVLAKDGQQTRLKLKVAQTKAGVVVPPPTPEMRRTILNNLRMLAAAADQYYLENGVATATYDALVGRTKYVKEIMVQAGEDYRSIVFAQGKTMAVTTAGGLKISYDP